MHRLMIVTSLLVLAAGVMAARLRDVGEKAQLDKVLSTFMSNNGFYQSQLGVLHGDRLIYAENRVSDSSLSTPAAHDDVMPVHDLSKVITAVAVLQLVEEGLLRLDDRVFGTDGVLWFITPVNNTLVDKRLQDVTIEHLLRHAAGWDEHNSALRDPMMNQLLVRQGEGHPDVPDIAATIGRPARELDQYDIIRYVIGQPLDYTPGERVITSNFGYCVLGKVIKEVARKEYADYVKEHILTPAGMRNTHLGGDGQVHQDKLGASTSTLASQHRQVDQLNYQLLDSTLGWYSNVYDLARFFTALYGGSDHSTPLLRDSTIAHALEWNDELQRHHTARWSSGLAVSVSDDGVTSLESSDRSLGLTVSFYRRSAVESGDNTNQQNSIELQPQHTTILFIGYTATFKKHVFDLNDAILSLNLGAIQQNAYVSELADMELTTDKRHTLVSVSVNEHHLEAYVNGMQIAGYFVKWLHGYDVNGRTHFFAIFERATSDIQLQYKVMKSASKTKLLKFITRYSKLAYYVDWIETVASSAHHGHLVHIVLMKRQLNPNLITFSLGSDLHSYRSQQLRQYALEGYQVVTQSIAQGRRQQQVSYVLQQPINSNQLRTRAFDALTLDVLVSMSRQQSQDNFYLSYLDRYTLRDNTQHFSAVFAENHQQRQYQFETGIKQGQFLAIAYEMSSRNFTPELVVAYTKNGSSYFAVQWAR